MKQRFRLYRRHGIYYTHDDQTGKQASLGTRDRGEAFELFSAKTQAHRQAHLNLRLARTYLTATDPLIDKRNWQTAMEELAKSKRGTWGERWQRAIKDKSFDCLRDMTTCGYPERFAQEALGHNSKAIHRAYARKAKVKLPSLEAYEKRASETEIIPMPFQRGVAADQAA